MLFHRRSEQWHQRNPDRNLDGTVLVLRATGSQEMVVNYFLAVQGLWSVLSRPRTRHRRRARRRRGWKSWVTCSAGCWRTRRASVTCAASSTRRARSTSRRTNSSSGVSSMPSRRPSALKRLYPTGPGSYLLRFNSLFLMIFLLCDNSISLYLQRKKVVHFPKLLLSWSWG